MTDYLFELEGYRERMSPEGPIKIIEIDFTADPAKRDPSWWHERVAEQGIAAAQREYQRNWSISVGISFYSEYQRNGGILRYGFKARGILPTWVFRGWDFGQRRPVCIWGQIGPTGRVYQLRELALDDTDIWTFSDLILYLSGQKPREALEPTAETWLQALEQDPAIPPMPWFPAGTTFRDISGPECFKDQSAARPGDPRSDFEVLQSKDIVLEAPAVGVADRTKVMRRILKIRPDGLPGILVDYACQHTHAMLGGGLTFAKPTPENPVPDAPRKDGWFDNIHDGLTYPLVQLVPLIEAPRPEPGTVWINRVPVPMREVQAREEASVGWYETRKGVRR